MDLSRNAILALFIHRVLWQSVEDVDSERSGRVLLAYEDIGADTSEKCDADCFTGVS
jgi:hypothetical protein